MTRQMKIFKPAGVQRFRDIIDVLQNEPEQTISLDWIHDESYAKVITPEIQLEPRKFKNKLDVAVTLLPVIEDLNLPEKYYHQGLWGWLSAFFFESVCPANSSGERKAGKAYRYIPPANRNWRTVYRHLLAGPVRLYGIHNLDIKILFHAPVQTLGDFTEQLSSRQELAASRGALEAADLLYWDRESDRPKTGARTTGDEPGSLRRYVSILRQLMLTYDLFSLDARSILNLLPKKEFDPWK